MSLAKQIVRIMVRLRLVKIPLYWPDQTSPFSQAFIKISLDLEIIDVSAVRP